MCTRGLEETAIDLDTSVKTCVAASKESRDKTVRCQALADIAQVGTAVCLGCQCMCLSHVWYVWLFAKTLESTGHAPRLSAHTSKPESTHRMRSKSDGRVYAVKTIKM